MSSSKPRCAAIIVGAGRGRRFGGDIPKQYRSLAGEPVVRRTLRQFSTHPDVDLVLPVIHMDDRGLFEPAAEGLSVLSPVAGGDTRQESVRNGLDALAGEKPDIVLIHDAARPFVTCALISNVIAALQETAGAIPGLPVSDTLKRGADGRISATVDRAGLWRAQTPQGFRFADISSAHDAFARAGLTDDAAVAEAAGLSVALVTGSEENFKITTQDDLVRAETQISQGEVVGPADGIGRNEGMEMMETRLGTGFDVHRFGPGDHVILCGIEIPHGQALMGHSDADVGLHALTDALLGAIGEGDIGQHFPPTDAKWKGAASDIFLAHAGDLVRGKGGRIVNLDLTLICQAPKIGPHRPAMEARIAEILKLSVERVCVKATTTEELGFTGRGEGIAAQAAASVALPFTDG